MGGRNAFRGKKRPAETIAKMSLAKMGHPVSPATRAKLRAANIGKHYNAETRAKMSAAQKAWRMIEKDGGVNVVVHKMKEGKRK